MPQFCRCDEEVEDLVGAALGEVRVGNSVLILRQFWNWFWTDNIRIDSRIDDFWFSVPTKTNSGLMPGSEVDQNRNQDQHQNWVGTVPASRLRCMIHCALSPSQLPCLSVHHPPLSAWMLPHGCDMGWERVFPVEHESLVSSHRPSRGPSHAGELSRIRLYLNTAYFACFRNSLITV
jgi:hypothetical protein